MRLQDLRLTLSLSFYCFLAVCLFLTQWEDLPQQDAIGPHITLSGEHLVEDGLRGHPLEREASLLANQITGLEKRCIINISNFSNFNVTKMHHPSYVCVCRSYILIVKVKCRLIYVGSRLPCGRSLGLCRCPWQGRSHRSWPPYCLIATHFWPPGLCEYTVEGVQA